MPNGSLILWSSVRKSPDGKLGAIVEVGAEDPEVVIAVSPTATATGVLLDEQGKPAANQELYWGRRVYLDEEQKGLDDLFRPQGHDRRRRQVHAAIAGGRPGVRDLRPEGEPFTPRPALCGPRRRARSTWERSGSAPIMRSR